MNILTEAICDGKTGLASTKRIALMIAASAMSACIIMLGVAAILGNPVAGELGAVSVPLAGMCGWSYVGGKAQEMKRDT